MDHQSIAQLLGNYGEFIGAIAVVATLAYLAVQVRQNTATMANAEFAHHSTIETELNLRFHEIRRDLYSDAGLAEIFRTGMFDPATLNAAQWDRFYHLCVSLFWAFAEQHRLSETLLVKRDPIYDALYVDLFRYPGVRAFWRSDGHIHHDPEWRDLVQSAFERTEPETLEELIKNPSPLMPNAPTEKT